MRYYDGVVPPPPPPAAKSEEPLYVVAHSGTLSRREKRRLRKQWASGFLILEEGMTLRRVDDGAAPGIDVKEVNRRGWLKADEVRELQGLPHRIDISTCADHAKGVRRFIPGYAPMTVNEVRELEGLPPLRWQEGTMCTAPNGSDTGGHTMPRVGMVGDWANMAEWNTYAMPMDDVLADIIGEPDYAIGDDYPVLSPTAWYWTWRVAAVVGIWAAWAGGVWWYSSWV